MWPSIRRWRDWATTERWLRWTLRSQPPALHVSLDSTESVAHDRPIPWNAATITVEAALRLPEIARSRADFVLRLASGESVRASGVQLAEVYGCDRVTFHFPPPPLSTTADLLWRGRLLARIALPILDAPTYFASLHLDAPTLAVRLGNQPVVCQSFVASQCKGFFAVGVLTSPSGLAPLSGVDVHVRFRTAGLEITVPVTLTAAQLASHRALIFAALPKPPRRTGEWTATWHADDRTLATQSIRAVTSAEFAAALQMIDAQLIVEDLAGTSRLQRAPPSDAVARLGPRFSMVCNQPGLAGLARLRVRIADAGEPLYEQSVLVTDRPIMLDAGLIAGETAGHASGFELLHRGDVIGSISLCAVPTARFTAEGGFLAPGEFAWSASAEDELSERLEKLMDEPGKFSRR